MVKGMMSALVVAVMFGAGKPVHGEWTWPTWRGEKMLGVAREGARPVVEWSETKNVKWKVKLPGSGTSSPVVWGDQVFIQTAIPIGNKTAGGVQPTAAGGGGRGGLSRAPGGVYQFVLMSVDRRDGTERWRRVVKEEQPHEGHHPDHGFASYSPVTDGEVVVAFFGSRGMHCFDMAGELKWSKDLGRMRTKMSFGEGSSPALHGGKVVLNWDHEGEDFIAAFEKETGREIWRKPREEDTSWSTPLVVEYEGKAQVVVSATKRIRSYDLETGAQVWECGGMTANVIPTPVVGEGVLYAASGFRGNALLAIRLGKSGDLTGTDAIVWSVRRNTPYVPSPLLYEGRLYMFSGNTGALTCLEAKTGKVLIDGKRIEGLEGVYASPVGAAGRVYLTGRNGTTVVIKSSDALEVLGTNVLEDRIDASAAVVGDELFLRGHEHLYCIGEK